ncbi:hypothetical protein IJG79_01750 [Candidatus Saccharibacteria bacterium]|nr:hypothetical protein [Candidatus Saccharibacteria bacterium]
MQKQAKSTQVNTASKMPLGKEETKRNQRRDLLIAAIAMVLVLLGVFIYLNRITIYDWVLAMSYHAPQEVTEVQNKISLTDRAGLIFAATHPSLEDREAFNKNCDSHTTEVSVLGCYAAGQIHIYNIQSPELNGVIESTAAHELLHAVWERMKDSDKSKIGKALMDVYNDSKYHDLLDSDLSSYDSADRVDELHSRIGTEIADLPDILEQHYARYFKNQDEVVSYYDKYITPFRELDEEIRELEQELEKTNKEIDEKSSEYYKRAELLSGEIDEFNKCARTEGCFANNSSFIARRNELLGAQSSLEDLFNQTNEVVNYYNNLVVEYNSHILRGQELEKAMNSNSEMEEIK